MSNLVDLYNTSDKLRPKQSREQIPGGAVDFFDREHKVADGFTVGDKKGDPTKFVAAPHAYEDQVNDLVPPESFNASLPLHRYTPTTPFYNPGAPSSGV